ncbi:MAG TPA: UDP-N-acetylglucosamine 2-epimerase (non-hydrolyzing) [Chloroflexota bacterium]|nr:UDP-N-acetylglucosamine 2-epimerase (non-hydrolyzing) [Chloroflexota bacterium]
MLKVLTVFGTRPEAVKLAPVIHELARHADRISSRVLVTAQHRDMLDQVLRMFSIEPHYDLDLMQDNQTPTQVAAAVLARLEPILLADRPDWVLVQGDTTTVAAAALAGFYARAHVGHVEAGLRTGDRWQPFPEEINRRIAGVIADRHFAPTTRSRDNLLREDVPAERILVTGNPGIDALRWITAQPLHAEVTELLGDDLDVRTVLVTAHRRENFGEPFESICLALRDLATRYAGRLRIVYPVHRNPNVWGPAHQLLGDVPNIVLRPPLDYLPNLQLMQRAYMVITDSGGIQEEATGLGIPALVLREVTERPEGVATGALRIVGTDRPRIVAEASRLLDEPAEYAKMAHAENPFGDGHAAERIVASLLADPD